MTDLDDALEMAKANPAQANFFYDAFLNATLFIPAQRADKSAGEWRAISKTERFYPLYLKDEEKRAVPVFDTLERLQNWADPTAFDYIELQGHLFLKVIAKDVSVFLNPGVPSNHHFPSDILERLRQSVKVVTPS